MGPTVPAAVGNGQALTGRALGRQREEERERWGGGGDGDGIRVPPAAMRGREGGETSSIADIIYFRSSIFIVSTIEES
jgi:hypothetical protein